MNIAAVDGRKVQWKHLCYVAALQKGLAPSFEVWWYWPATWRLLGSVYSVQ